MPNQRLTVIALLAVAAFCALPAAATPVCSIADISATLPYSGTGCFNLDENEQSFVFTLDATETVSMFTTSWLTGGFAPVLTLFDNGADSNFIASDTTGGEVPDLCGARGIGGVDDEQTCLDAYITAVLGPGAYRLVLTESGNVNFSDLEPPNFDLVNSPYLPCLGQQDGVSFSQCGNGNFTGGDGFLSPNNGDQLSNQWAVTISGEAVPTDTPEPVTGTIAISGLLLTLAVARRKTLARPRN